MDEILLCDHSNGSYQQYFPPVLFLRCIRVYKAVLTFESVDEPLTCHRLCESHLAVFSSVLFITLHKVSLLLRLEMKPLSKAIQMKGFEQ